VAITSNPQTSQCAKALAHRIITQQSLHRQMLQATGGGKTLQTSKQRTDYFQIAVFKILNKTNNITDE
jgi:hypothetical protein